MTLQFFPRVAAAAAAGAGKKRLLWREKDVFTVKRGEIVSF